VRLTPLGLPPSTLFNPLNSGLRFSRKALVSFRMSWVPSMSSCALRSIFSAEQAECRTLVHLTPNISLPGPIDPPLTVSVAIPTWARPSSSDQCVQPWAIFRYSP
jgi:hypothetical protein